jgi:hypothetical protein
MNERMRHPMAVQTESHIIDSLFDQIGNYGDTRIEILKLSAVDKASELISFASVRAALYLMVSGAILFSSIAIALLLGEWLGRYSYGFFIVSIAFVLAAILIYVLRDKWIRDPVARLVITKALG